MNLIFFRLTEISIKKGQKTASMRVAHLSGLTEKENRLISYHLITKK